MDDPITAFLNFILPGFPKEVFGVITLLIGALWAIREEILPARRAYNNEKKRLELLKLWYEVRGLVGDEAVEPPPAHLLAPVTQKTGESPAGTPSQILTRLSFTGIPPSRQLRYVLIAVGIMMLSSQVLSSIGAPLITPASPNGIVSFELARSLPAAEAMIQSWSTEARMAAALSLGLDFVYIVIYTTALSLLCILASTRLQRMGRFGASLGSTIVWGLLVAGVLDAIENIALLRLLFGDLSAIWVNTAWLCASGKFSLISLAMIYILLGLVTSMSGFLFRSRDRRT